MSLTETEQRFLQELEQIASNIIYDYQKEQITIKLVGTSTTLYQSKFGGTPYLAHNAKVPTNAQGQQFKLLAQINLEELPNNKIFNTTTGILQFWVLNDDCYGLDDKDGYKVTFCQNIDTSVTQEEVLAKYNPYCENDEDYFPIEGEFALQFTHTIGYCTSSDETFSKAFEQKILELYHNKKEQYADIFAKYTEADNKLDCFKIECFLFDNHQEIYDKLNQWGHKIGGYPNYTQSDIREETNQDYDILLLQIDTDMYDDQEIIWGDSGVANFFIKAKDLANLNFENVLYSWDCC